MRRLTVALVCLAGLAGPAPPGDAKPEKVKLRLHGIVSAKDSAILTEALGKLPSVKVSGRPTSDDPIVTVEFIPGKTDVGELARVVNEANTSGRERSKPQATLLLEYSRSDGGSDNDGTTLLRIVKDALPKIKGVDTDRSSFELKSRTLLILFDDSGKARISELRKGFPGLSIK
jgi:hypothetical protein